MAYNSQAEAIKKLRGKKSGMDDFFSNDEIQAGVEDLPMQNRETDLAPGLKKPGDDISLQDEIAQDPQVEMTLQDEALDQGDSVLPRGMYEAGDENKKGFMGKAAMLMKKKMGM